VATVDLGKISFVNKGTYAAGTTYEERDVVQFTDGALSSYVYINATPASGQTPSTGGTVNSSHWSIFAGGVSLAVGNNKVVTTDGSGTVGGLSIGSTGQVLKVTGTNTLGFAAASAGLQSIQTFTSSGTYTKPSGITKVKVIVTAGGGSGGANNTADDVASGGGAGGTAIEVIDVSSVSTVTVTVGSGGAQVSGASHGNAGGSSSFGSYCSATGGGGGREGNSGGVYGGAGGSATGGNINIEGGDGINGQDNVYSSSYESSFGNGGSSFWGGGGRGATHNNGAQAGKAYGSGGGGSNALSNTYGAAGQGGIVVVEEYA